MRITSLFATFVAGVLLVGSGSLHGQNQPPAAQAPPRASSGNNVAVIDIGYIFRNNDRFKAAMDDIKKDSDKFEQYVREQQTQVNAKTEKLKASPAGSPEYRKLEEEIAETTTRLRLEMGRRQKERIEKEAKVYYNAYKEIEWYVQRFADRYGIDLVVRFNSEDMDPNKPESVLQGINRFIVFNRGLDISNHILDALRSGAGVPQPNTNQAGPANPAAASPATEPRVGRPPIPRPTTNR